MTEMQNKVRVQSHSVAFHGKAMYLRLLVMNPFKKVPLRRVLRFENAPVPISMFNDDKSMLSCTNSDCMHKLESLHENDIISVQSADCIIFNAMTIMQMLHFPMWTLKVSITDMAKHFLQYSLQCSRAIQSVVQMHIVCDKENSLKHQTLQKRGDIGASHKIHSQSNISISKEWKKVLARGEKYRKFSSILRKLCDRDCR